MKKVVVVFLVLSLTILSGCKPDEEIVEESPNIDTSSLGHSINVVTENEYNDMVSTMVLDMDVLSGLEYVYEEEAITLIRSYSSDNLRTLKEEDVLGYNIKVDDEEYTVMVSEYVYDLSDTLNYAGSDNLSLYVYENMDISYTVGINEDPTNYQVMLSSPYLYDLDKLEKDYISAEDLFDKYGTHLITSGYYGGKEKVVVSSTSKTDVDDSISIQNELDTLLNNKNSTMNDVNNVFDSYYNDNEVYDYAFNFYTIGGMNSASNTITGYHTLNNTWRDSITEENSELVYYPEDGLLPLWDFLPAEYLHLQNDLKEAFKEYYDAHMNKLILDTLDESNPAHILDEEFDEVRYSRNLQDARMTLQEMSEVYSVLENYQYTYDFSLDGHIKSIFNGYMTTVIDFELSELPISELESVSNKVESYFEMKDYVLALIDLEEFNENHKQLLYDDKENEIIVYKTGDSEFTLEYDSSESKSIIVNTNDGTVKYKTFMLNNQESYIDNVLDNVYANSNVLDLYFDEDVLYSIYDNNGQTLIEIYDRTEGTRYILNVHVTPDNKYVFGLMDFGFDYFSMEITEFTGTPSELFVFIENEENVISVTTGNTVPEDFIDIVLPYLEDLEVVLFD